MIKGALIETIIGTVLKQSQTQDSLKQVHQKDVEYLLSTAYSSLLKQYFADSRNMMAVDFDFYAKKYTLTVSKESTFPYLRYVAIPVNIFELPSNLGIRSVRPVASNYSFTRTTEDEIATYKDLEVFNSGEAYFYKDGSRLSIIYTSDKYKLIDQVVVKLIPHFEDFAMTDNIEFSMGESEAIKAILQLMGVRPTDNVNDDIK